jgi:hypothetical protein
MPEREVTPSEIAEEEVRAPRHVLDDPRVQEDIDDALAVVREGRTQPGLRGDELLNLAREQRRVDARRRVER